MRPQAVDTFSRRPNSASVLCSAILQAAYGLNEAAVSSANGLCNSSHSDALDQSYSAHVPAIMTRRPPRARKERNSPSLAFAHRKLSELLQYRPGVAIQAKCSRCVGFTSFIDR